MIYVVSNKYGPIAAYHAPSGMPSEEAKLTIAQVYSECIKTDDSPPEVLEGKGFIDAEWYNIEVR